MQRQIFLSVMLSLLLFNASTGWSRTWTDKTGKHTVEAELVEVKDGEAVLKKTDGKVVRVPVARLSKADQKYLESLGKADQKPADDSPVTQPAAVPRDKTLAAVPRDEKLAAVVGEGQHRLDSRQVGKLVEQRVDSDRERPRAIASTSCRPPISVTMMSKPSRNGFLSICKRNRSGRPWTQ